MSRIQFDPKQMERIQEFLESIPEPSTMTPEQLEAYQEKGEDAIDTLNDLEPRDENSEVYDEWADLHEDLEDMLDEIQDCL